MAASRLLTLTRRSWLRAGVFRSLAGRGDCAAAIRGRQASRGLRISSWPPAGRADRRRWACACCWSAGARCGC